MNYKQALAELLRLFDGFDFVVHSEIVKELTDLLAGTGNEVRILRQILTRFQYLATYLNQAQNYQPDNFERLNERIYSMKVRGNNYNLRILYGFRELDVCILSVFYERQGKRNTDYTNYIRVATARLQELIEE